MSETPATRVEHAEHEEASEAGLQEVLLELQQLHFQGPLPPPQLLRGYEDVLSGAAERIFLMTEGQARHRQEMEQATVNGALRAESRGTYCGMLVVLAFLVASVFLIANGYTVAGTILGTIDLVALAAIFVGQRRGGTDSDGDKSSK